jgi:hypothetical protein
MAGKSGIVRGNKEKGHVNKKRISLIDNIVSFYHGYASDYAFGTVLSSSDPCGPWVVVGVAEWVSWTASVLPWLLGKLFRSSLAYVLPASKSTNCAWLPLQQFLVPFARPNFPIYCARQPTGRIYSTRTHHFLFDPANGEPERHPPTTVLFRFLSSTFRNGVAIRFAGSHGFKDSSAHPLQG